MLASVTAEWTEAAWVVQGWLRPGKLPKVLPFLSRASPLLVCWKPAVAPSAVELVFAFCNLLLIFYAVLHQCFPLPLSQEEWWWRLKYSHFLQGQGHARGTLRNQNDSPHGNVSDCYGTMWCGPRKVTITIKVRYSPASSPGSVFSWGSFGFGCRGGGGVLVWFFFFLCLGASYGCLNKLLLKIIIFLTWIVSL